MSDLVRVKNWFLTSYYGLVVRMGSRLVKDKNRCGKGNYSWKSIEIWSVSIMESSSIIANCQTKRLFELGQAWCYPYYFEFSFAYMEEFMENNIDSICN